MYEIFKKLCEEKGITPYRFCKDTGINSSTISTWKKKGTKCSFKLADTIAQYFNVSIDYIMTGKPSLPQSGTTTSATDPRDVKKKYEEIKMLLQSRDTQPLFFDGKPAADESIDLLLKQVEISLALIEKNWN